MQTVKILKDQQARKDSIAAEKWSIIRKHDGKPLAALKAALEKLPKGRQGLSWHVQQGYIVLEGKPEKSPRKPAAKPAKPAKAKGKGKPATKSTRKAQKFQNLVDK